MATGRVNVGGGGGGGINVYAQLSEPTKKEGIWIKTGTAKKDIVNDLDLWLANAWNNPTLKSYASMPNEYTAITQYKGIASIGSNVYVMGGVNYALNKYVPSLYKYDSINDIWIRLADMPSAPTSQCEAVAIGTDIYVIQQSGIFYKYDTINNTWTSLKSTSSGFMHRIVAVGTDIYSFYTSGSNYSPSLLKYDTLNNTWSVLTANGGQSGIRVVSYGTDIYMINAGSADYNSGNNTKKYDTINKTYTLLANMPIGGCYPVIVGTDIHAFYIGSSPKHYVYSIPNNTWTLLSDTIPTTLDAVFAYIGGAIELIEQNQQAQAKNFRYNFASKTYENGTVVIYRLSKYGAYQAELCSLAPGVFTGINGANNRMLTGFDNVLMYLNNNLNDNLPTYYGDGTKWVQFKGF